MSDVPEQGTPFSSPSTPFSLPLCAKAASPCESHYCNCTGMELGVRWSLFSPHPLLFSCRYSPHVVKWPANIFSLSPLLPLTQPLTQKSINSFQVRSKTQMLRPGLTETSGTIKPPFRQRWGWTDKGRLLPLFANVWSCRKQLGSPLTNVQPNNEGG